MCVYFKPSKGESLCTPALDTADIFLFVLFFICLHSKSVLILIFVFLKSGILQLICILWAVEFVFKSLCFIHIHLCESLKQADWFAASCVKKKAVWPFLYHVCRWFTFGRIPGERFHNKLVWAPLRLADSQIQLKHDANIPANTPYHSQRNAGFQSQLCPMWRAGLHVPVWSLFTC